MVFIGYYINSKFFDSLNPSAIAQQMLLQAMVKKKRHIWFFICGIGTANLIMGLAIYYGIATWVSKFLTKIVNAYPLYVYGAAAIGGIVLLGAGIRLIIKTRQSNAGKDNNGPFLFPAYPTKGNWQTVRTEPQRSGLPYPQGCPAASRRNGGNDA